MYFLFIIFISVHRILFIKVRVYWCRQLDYIKIFYDIGRPRDWFVNVIIAHN